MRRATAKLFNGLILKACSEAWSKWLDEVQRKRVANQVASRLAEERSQVMAAGWLAWEMCVADSRRVGLAHGKMICLWQMARVRRGFLRW